MATAPGLYTLEPAKNCSSVQSPSDPQRLQAASLASRVEVAYETLQSHRRKNPRALLYTPLHHAVSLPDQPYLKLETEQVTNSFKVRGALNGVHAAVARGETEIVTASSGNHAMGVVHAVRLCGATGVIFLPTNAKRCKVDVLRSFAGKDVEVRIEGDNCVASELAAAAYAKARGARYVSSYNDELVIGGHGTVGSEILEQVSHVRGAVDGLNVCYVSVGGGGLAAGTAAVLKHTAPGRWRVVGCLPERSAVMYECVKAGRVVPVKCSDTLSDGSGGEIEEGSITVPFCTQMIDAWAIVGEAEIADAMQSVFVGERKVVEGAAGVAVAGFFRDRKWREENAAGVCVIVACGANVDPGVFADVVKRGAGSVDS